MRAQICDGGKLCCALTACVLYGNETSGTIIGVQFVGEKKHSQFQNKNLRKFKACNKKAAKDAAVKYETQVSLQ